MRVARKYPLELLALSRTLHIPDLPQLIRRFLYDQLLPNSIESGAEVDLNKCPTFSGIVRIFHSAVATFHAPSDPSGIGGMHRERIRATPVWRGGSPRNDCVFLANDAVLEGMQGLHVVRVLLFFAFTRLGTTFPCALVQWFTMVGEDPCDQTGMWMVE